MPPNRFLPSKLIPRPEKKKSEKDASTLFFSDGCGSAHLTFVGAKYTNLGQFTNWRIDDYHFRPFLLSDTMWLRLPVEITIAMGRTTMQILFLIPLVPVHWTTRLKSLISFSMGKFSSFHVSKDDGSSLSGIVIAHSLQHLMISSLLPSAGSLRHPPNFEFTLVGGCQQEVKKNDQIPFAFDAFNANVFLKLTGPVAAHVNVPVQLTVTDGQTGNPVAGASVDGGTTDANGHVTVTFTHAGNVNSNFRNKKPLSQCWGCTHLAGISQGRLSFLWRRRCCSCRWSCLYEHLLPELLLEILPELFTRTLIDEVFYYLQLLP